jgi:hypothetical protein
MVGWLRKTNVVAQRYPVPALNLAALVWLSGDSVAACQLFSEIASRVDEGWRGRIGGITERLGSFKAPILD